MTEKQKLHLQKLANTRRGMKFSKEWRRKITEDNLRNPRRYWLGKKRLDVTGDKCHLYKDGRCKNKEYMVWIKNKRNRMKMASEGSHTFGEWELLKKQYGYTCLACGKKPPEITLSEDHIIPLSRGGSDYIENIQPLCRSCNSKKYNKIIINLKNL